MSYNVLPKMNNILKSNIQYSNYANDHDETHETHKNHENNMRLEPIISNSIFDYYNEIMVEIKKILVNEYTFQETLKNYNPYEYLFSTVPSFHQCVSELQKSNIFYDLHEIIKTIEIIDNLRGTLNCLFVGKHCKDILHVYDTHRFVFDSIFMFEKGANLFQGANLSQGANFSQGANLCEDGKISERMFHFIVYEIDYDLTNIDAYISTWVTVLKIILNNLAINGDVIIKCDMLHHKPIIDILFIYANLFKKTYIMKPTASNVFSFEKYIILKGFTSNYYAYAELKNDLNSEHHCGNGHILGPGSKTISNIVSNDIPYFFLTKMNELNVLLGKQQLEALGDLLNILKHKSKEEKFELLKKINIYKCIHWCDKFAIPCNRFLHIPCNRSSFK